MTEKAAPAFAFVLFASNAMGVLLEPIACVIRRPPREFAIRQSVGSVSANFGKATVRLRTQERKRLRRVRQVLPNPSIERTNTGKPVFASHLKR